MQITSIETVPFTIPYRHPVVAASGVLRSAQHVLVRVHSDDGLVGVGEAVARSFVYGESQASIVAAFREWLEPAVIGLDPFAVEEILERTNWVVANNTARGALDIALHDLRGKATGLPSWRLLGGMQTSVQVTRILGMGEAQEVADEASQAFSEQGVASFKVKVGTHLLSDVARIAAVREAVGEDATIYVDANHGWTAEQAIRALTAMAEYNVALVEEPSPAGDRIGRLRVAQQVPIPIMADESAPTVADAARELTSGSARALSIKTTRTGFTESARLVALADALGARTLLGSQADSMIGAAASLAFGAAHPQVAREPGELDYFSVLADYVVTEPLEVRGGVLTASQRPGIAVEIDEDKLSHYRVDDV
ncbi:mandelate racemase/muconate lactonizing enzyme family protein [Saccharopolyspora mangrovi]|uniref:Enolase C-terminal domain-like protein n=1 Tax=Saccharopolyspora mangrovi TaxID=3082379 RepID=A0ABU6AL54_9PSEU|nr:enolase C-terminal domain-like protein [Saccharopolyspora sp. S2-29]MEB3372281.1 enolase C-terminal domain-like protein [Saccharopolyspora sp. S2-29]